MEIIQPPSPEERRRVRNSYLLGSVIAIGYGAVGVIQLLSGSANPWSTLPTLVSALLMIWLTSTQRQVSGSVILIAVVAVQTVVAPFYESQGGIPNAISAVALIGGVGLATLPRQYTTRLLLLSLIIAIISILTDFFGTPGRIPVSGIGMRWMISTGAFLLFSIYFAIEFPTLDIRTKVVMGILATGGISISVLSFFALERTGQIVNTLSGRLVTSVTLLAEEQLVNTVSEQSATINRFFEEMAANVSDLAVYRTSLESERNNLGTGTYWNAQTRLIQLPAGQYGNPGSDISSVFIPLGTNIDDATLLDLNTSAYLDFPTPAILQANPSILAIYYIDTKGITRYYPNIDLAQVLPPDFDATSRPYFEITAPLFNPKRTPRWTIPYLDATGGGLVVTVAAPVYYGDRFDGVVAADLQLTVVAQQVSSLKIGSSGYALIVDDAGRIIHMPQKGYEMFGIDPSSLDPDEFFKQTIMGEGSQELTAITNRMVAGGTGLNIIDLDGEQTYFTYAPIQSNGYSLALVVPVAEMQGAIVSARNETQNQLQSAIRIAVVIFISMFIFAILVSIGIGQVIATPIIRLTETADRIVSGDLDARAEITSSDEIGQLAASFNTMTLRLRETLSGLEKSVHERTTELMNANTKIQDRVRQLSTISEISRVINQTQGLQELLPKITQAISQLFNYYHVGVFLIDANHEYAVLVAANSDGGRRMLARNHKLKVGQVGIVGYVAGTGLPRTALDTGADSIFFNNPDLPETHSEIALPLIRPVRQLIGVLDVQSTQVNAFGPEDIQVLSTLAEQVTIAITNAKLYEETQKAILESEMLYRRDLRSGWKKFTRIQKLVGIHRKGLKTTILRNPFEIPRSLGQAASMDLGNPQADGDQIALPVRLRGEVVGVLKVKSEEHRKWTPDELDIVNAIIEKAALSIEGSRLLMESRKLADKERIISDISSRVSSFTNRENILLTAVEEIGRALPGAEVSLQIQPGGGSETDSEKGVGESR